MRIYLPLDQVGHGRELVVELTVREETGIDSDPQVHERQPTAAEALDGIRQLGFTPPKEMRVRSALIGRLVVARRRGHVGEF